MPFQFSLAGVLKFRESTEQREYLALERIHQEVVHMEARLRQIEEWRQAAAQRREADLAEGIPSIHLQGDFQQELSLEQQRDAFQGKLQELKAKRQIHLKAYQKARQKREVIAELRTRQENAYDREQAKRQQNLIDDLFLSRRKRGE